MSFDHLSIQPAHDRRRGIALMVVMVVFVVLYLVVYNLRFWTGMEERIAAVRYSDSESHDALYSAALQAMVILLEDLKQDVTEAGEQGGMGAAGGMASMPGAAGGMASMPGAAGGGGAGGAGAPGGGGGAASTMVPLDQLMGGGGAAGSSSSLQFYDYLRETVFNDSTETVGSVEVKTRIRDNEAKLDLNRLFDYAKVQLDAQAAAAGVGLLGEGAELDAITGDVVGAADEAEAASNLRERMLSRTTTLSDDRRSEGGSEGGGGEGAGAAGGEDDSVTARLQEAGLQVPGLEGEGELDEFEPPTGEVVLATEAMVERAVLTMISMNEDRGYFYQETYGAAEIARDIVEYVMDRRSSPGQNIIYHPSELLNLYSVTPELYYGPRPALDPGEEIYLDSGFIIRQDAFGDLQAEYDYSTEFLAQREAEQQLLVELKEQFADLGSFLDFPHPGLSPIRANALTRGMTEPVIEIDEAGFEYVVEPPLPIGLAEIFCTFSTGKVNINTAPVPVLYALLPSLSEGVDGEANFVAVSIGEYRNEFQEEVFDEAEGVERTSEVPDLGQPRRQGVTEEEELANEEALLSEFGLEDMELAGSTYEDLETNYFTNLRQVELVDGTAGDADDRLRSDLGVDRVGGEQDSLLERVTNDYTPVMVFGSTFFTIELKAKAKKSPLVKRGFLVVKRDTENRLLDVVLWKEFRR